MNPARTVEAVLGNVVALVAIGMGIAFLLADWRSRNSRMLATFLTGIGVTIWTSAGYQLFRDVDALPWPVRLSGLFTALTMIAGAEWLLRIRRTIPAADLQTRFGDRMIRWAQVFAALYGILTLVYWRNRAQWVIERLGTMDGLTDPVFLKFAVPFFLSILLVGAVGVLTLNRKPDWPEKMRLVALVIALPFLASGFVLPPELAAYGSVVGLTIILVGALEYHVAQGQRGVFMSRFLAPQVADLVRREGLEQAIRDQKCDISAVSCDIRGFTAFAEQAETEAVIDLLRRYYDAIGAAATEVGGTIKDYAGDGVLVLIGAPLPYPDRAARALRLAETLVRETPALFAGSGAHGLGIGIGIASGAVSVGVVGGARLEYVAVGSTVNLAARLCQIARSGQILLDRETRALLGDDRRLTEEPRVALKGFAEPVPVYAFG